MGSGTVTAAGVFHFGLGLTADLVVPIKPTRRKVVGGIGTGFVEHVGEHVGAVARQPLTGHGVALEPGQVAVHAPRVGVPHLHADVVEAALERAGAGMRILDLGTGSVAIALGKPSTTVSVVESIVVNAATRMTGRLHSPSVEV